MEVKGLILDKKSRLRIARGQFTNWSNQRTESKIYKATLFALAKGVCPDCGVDMVLSFNKEVNEQPNAATLDHIIPLSEMLENNRYGLRICCMKCNTARGSKPLT